MLFGLWKGNGLIKLKMPGSVSSKVFKQLLIGLQCINELELVKVVAKLFKLQPATNVISVLQMPIASSYWNIRPLCASTMDHVSSLILFRAARVTVFSSTSLPFFAVLLPSVWVC